MEIREGNRRSRECSGDGIETALADHVRRTFAGPGIVKAVMAEWGLTDGEARGVIYANASRRTLNRILQHPRGGWGLLIEIGSSVVGKSLTSWIEERRAHERREYERMDHGLRKMAADLPAVLGVGGDRRP